MPTSPPSRRARASPSGVRDSTPRASPLITHTPADASLAGVERLVADHRPEAVEYAHWADIDAHERERGEAGGRPRVKLCAWEDLLQKR